MECISVSYEAKKTAKSCGELRRVYATLRNCKPLEVSCLQGNCGEVESCS